MSQLACGDGKRQKDGDGRMWRYVRGEAGVQVCGK